VIAHEVLSRARNESGELAGCADLATLDRWLPQALLEALVGALALSRSA
jgi:hypothetical protein